MSKVLIKFKDPDAIGELINSRHPLPDEEDEASAALEGKREDFGGKYFLWGDYGAIEIDPATLECRLMPRAEWESGDG